MSPFVGEIIGTGFLILLGNGVVANVVLNKSKGQNSGWIVITLGWGIAVFVGVYASAAASGGHINPAVTIALASIGKFPWSEVPIYIAGQMIGAMSGAVLVWLAYKNHFDETEDQISKLAVFSTGPEVRNKLFNFITETIGTFALVLGVLFIAKPTDAALTEFSLGSLDALPVALLVLGIGLSLGGPTGYAINPARDLGPRIMHAILPIKNKGGSDWEYSWIPVLAPITGGIIAALLFSVL